MQYDRELEKGRIDENAIYLTPDEKVNISDVLRYSKQTLTDEQKAQVIENLGLAEYIQSMIQTAINTTDE